MEKSNLQLMLTNFLDEQRKESHTVFEHTLFVCRNDGLVLYFHTQDKKVDKNSVGALVGGLWQAGKTVVDMFGKNAEPITYRLSFDTSSSGLHLLPFSVGSDEYFMGLYFSELVNPALLKNRMKSLMHGLSGQFEKIKHEEVVPQKKEEQLFSNITDDEIDNLFSFAEN